MASLGAQWLGMHPAGRAIGIGGSPGAGEPPFRLTGLRPAAITGATGHDKPRGDRRQSMLLEVSNGVEPLTRSQVQPVNYSTPIHNRRAG
jgi:hypothetical protein